MITRWAEYTNNGACEMETIYIVSKKLNKLMTILIYRHLNYKSNNIKIGVNDDGEW